MASGQWLVASGQFRPSESWAFVFGSSLIRIENLTPEIRSLEWAADLSLVRNWLKLGGLGRSCSDDRPGFGHCLKAVIHGLQTGAGSLQHQFEIFLCHGAVGGVN